MSRQYMHKSQNQQQQSKHSGILQRAAVRSVPASTENSQAETEELHDTESRLNRDLTLIPVSSKAPPIVQPKLALGQPDDKYEREADRIAAEVVARLNGPCSEATPESQTSDLPEAAPPFQTKTALSPIQTQEGGAISPELEASIQQAKGSGSYLQKPLRSKMEQAFGGSDFSGVKIHTGIESDRLNRSIQARAFTSGRDIFFRQGEYRPESEESQQLIAHELVHFEQQNPDRIQRAPGREEDFDPNSPRKLRNAWMDLNQRNQRQGRGRNRRDSYEQAIASGGRNRRDSAESSSNKKDLIQDIIEGASDSAASGAGITGDISDQGLVTEHLNDFKADFSEGLGNIAGGGLALYTAKKDFKNAGSKGEKALALTEGAAAAGQLAHGLAKTVKGGGLATNPSERAGYTWTAVGDVGASLADGAALVNGYAQYAKNLYDLLENWKSATIKERVARGFDVAGDVADLTKSGYNVTKDVFKAVREFGGSSSQFAPALTTAASIAGIVSGTIQIAQGGFQLYRSWKSKGAVKETKKQQQQFISSINDEIWYIEGLIDLIREEIGKARKSTPIHGDINGITELMALLKKAENKLIILGDTLAQLSTIQAKFAPAMSAMEKINNRKMEDSAFKMAGGTTAIASSALVMSGAGAPIAITVGAISGIIAIGRAITKFRRNQAADSLINIAQLLTPDGKRNTELDPDLSYREMEKRTRKLYYSHMTHVMIREPAPGLSDSEFEDIKTFVQQEKSERVSKGTRKEVQVAGLANKEDIKDPKNRIPIEFEMKKLRKQDLEENWIEISNREGKVIATEDPQGLWGKTKFAFSPSAHKSEQAYEANVEEVVNALYTLGTSGFNKEQEQFVDAPIKPIGEANPELVKEFSNLTLKGLLKSAEITDERWLKWLEKAEQKSDPAEYFKNKIKSHLGG